MEATVPRVDVATQSGQLHSGSTTSACPKLRETKETACQEATHRLEGDSKPRRTSESGIPVGRSTPRRSSGSGQASSSGAKLAPRDTRSSSLRKSLSGADSTLLRSTSAACSPDAAGYELTSSVSPSRTQCRLRDDLAAKKKEADKLGEEAATLKGLLAAKERALAKHSSEHESLNSRLLKAEGQLGSKLKELREVEGERNKLRAANQDLERQAERLNRKLSAQPKGTGFSEAIANLEAEVKGLHLGNAKLIDEAKGAQNLVRAKNKQLDQMAIEVEEARHIRLQNGELENYIRDLRRQLQSAADERATLLHVQRQAKTEMAVLTEEKDAANSNADRVGRELSLCKTQLKASEENAAELSHELELRTAELQRVTTVASRAIHREASSIKEDGTVPFAQHKEEVMHLKGEITRLKEKLRLEEKSGAATQQQVRHLYARLDALQGKVKASPREKAGSQSPLVSPRELAGQKATKTNQASNGHARYDQDGASDLIPAVSAEKGAIITEDSAPQSPNQETLTRPSTTTPPLPGSAMGKTSA